MLRMKTIARDLPQRLFDNHVNNVTLYLVNARPEQSLFVCNPPILCLVYVWAVTIFMYMCTYVLW